MYTVKTIIPQYTDCEHLAVSSSSSYAEVIHPVIAMASGVTWLSTEIAIRKLRKGAFFYDLY